MPYYLHVSECDQTSGEVFTDRASAFQAKTTGQIITFVASEAEVNDWTRRERNRLVYGDYVSVPWHDCEWAIDRHYAHLSRETVGLIAYTPSDEYGVQNRKLAVTPGRYLSQFAKLLSQREIDQYCFQVKGTLSTFSIATTAKEIKRVFSAGPDSCMTHHIGDYETGGIHPTAAYGDSDLAVAYMGDIDNVIARAVIWPEKQLHSTVYGDELLEGILRNAGYRSGSFAGAKIRAIELDNGAYVMPYVDSASGARLEYAGGKEWFVLTARHSDYSVKETNGTTGETSQSCAHCGDSMPYDEDHSLCDTCQENEYYCDHCDDYHFSDKSERHDLDLTYCDHCYKKLLTECTIENCYHEWIETDEFSKDERDERERDRTSDLCRTCAKEFQVCRECLDAFPIENPTCDCGTHVRCDYTLDLPL